MKRSQPSLHVNSDQGGCPTTTVRATGSRLQQAMKLGAPARVGTMGREHVKWMKLRDKCR